MLTAITIQDLKSRAVYGFWFVVLPLLLIIQIHFLNHQSIAEEAKSTAINLSFLFVQLLLVSIYFSIKNKKWVNITRELLGWGDILFLVCIAFYLSPLNYILFYITSLLLVTISWLLIKLFFKTNHTRIPLAGLQAIILIVFLLTDWLCPQIDLTNDYWLLHYVY